MRSILFLLLFAATPAAAEQLLLSPPASAVELRAYGLGVWPVDGKFTRFHGVLRYDAQHPEKCQVMLEIDASSLVMSDPSKQASVLGPEFMDVARYPDMAFDGACQGRAIAGSLRLHGDTHPFSLDVSRSGTALTASGRLTRADWGITARPLVVGPTIRIRVAFPNPLNGPHA